ncbi:MAG: sulfurtransferase-like selenium metabolism protein YedF [Chloroflexota bacterium]
MGKTVDARGLACPQPVILTRKALEQAGEVTTIVDNVAARDNVSRMAKNQGCEVNVQERDHAFYVHLVKAGEQPTLGAVVPAGGPTVLFIGADTIGRGSEELGGRLMKAFIGTIGQLAAMPKTIVFMNGGVRLVAEESPVLADLRFLNEHGIELLACGTCLDHFGIKDKVAVGKISNMLEIEEHLFTAGRIVSF